MSVITDLLRDIFFDGFMKLFGKLYEMLDDYDIINPKAARAGKILLILVLICVALALFATLLAELL